MSHPLFLFIGAKLCPFYQEIGAVGEDSGRVSGSFQREFREGEVRFPRCLCLLSVVSVVSVVSLASLFALFSTVQ